MLTAEQKTKALRIFTKRHNTGPPITYLKSDLVAMGNLIETRFDNGLANLLSGGSPVPADQRDELLRIMVVIWAGG